MGFNRLITAVVSIACAMGATACVPQNASKASSPSKLLTEGVKKSPDSLAPLTVPNNFAPAGETGVSMVASGLQHSCAVRNGALSCWGLNKHGQIANGESGVIQGTPDPFTGSNYLVRVVLKPHRIFDSGVTDLALGYEHSCAIRDGELFCWGSNEFRQLGLSAAVAGSTKIFTSPVSVLKGVKQVSARGRWTCAVTDTEKLVCFGTRLVASGSGNIPYLVSSTPKEIASGARSVSISANHACAVIQNGRDQSLRCFGMNSSGEIGNGLSDGEDVALPFEVFASSAVSVAVAEGRSCAMVGSSMKCFGTTLGDRAIDQTAGAWRVSSPTPYDSVFWNGIAPGLKISASGTVLSSSGDLFYGSYFHGEGRPQKAAIGVSTFDFSETDQNGCMMFRNHAVKCWGSNLFGQLGIGKRTTGTDLSIFRALDVVF